MKFSASTVLVIFPVLAAAHSPNHVRHNQNAVAASSASATPTSPGAASAPASGGIGPSVSLLSTASNAIPLSSIIANAPPQPTHSVTSSAPAGAQQTLIPGAPVLPNLTSISPANYPPLDKPPPTDSPQVQQWIKEVQASGVNIPDISPTVAGGCSANPQAVADDANRCWWTCGGCTRQTDIVSCPQKLTWGLTYDDGPSAYTPDLLNLLGQNNIKGTFFAIGSRAISLPAVLQAEYMEGHQVAVHTWSHPSLTTLSNDEIIAELGWSKKIIKDVLGVTPNMMRPPFGDIDDRVRAICIAMGLTPVIWTRISATATFDTDDFSISAGTTTVGQVLQNWEYILSNASHIDTGFIALEHDLFQQSVDVATGYILPDALAHNPGFNIQPVVTCLNKPLSDAYVETNDNKTNPPPASGSGAITLSSGAVGSAQQTGASGSSKSGSLKAGVNMSLFAVAGTAVAGFIAGAGALVL